MWQYSLDLEGGDEPLYVASYDFHSPVGVGDRFDYDGHLYEVVVVAVKQVKPGAGEPAQTLHCRLA